MQKVIILGLLLIMGISCSKESTQADSAIPYVPVNETVNINDPKYVNLKNIGGWAYLIGGSRGIILYRESTEVVRAYERQCTFDPIEVCSTVDMDAALLQANDADCCGSIFSLLNGAIIKGPASRPLIQYQTTFDGTNITVTN
jgi:nitrite reductase/ring-hydroxylating ferredoxin subunit